jgi:L-alanine-DL-glutamate epimerase-like enolase superfamily enzyme
MKAPFLFSLYLPTPHPDSQTTLGEKAMQIDQILVHQVSLPFAIDFSHSLRKRSSAKNIIVEIVADQGEIKGYGEGAPRSYVTGESQASATKSIFNLLQQDSFPWELNHISQIWDFVDALPDRKEHNSAICALEMALLDAWGKADKKSIIQYFPTDFFTPIVCYGIVVPIASKKSLRELCELIRKMGIKKLRLKMGRDLEQNQKTAHTVQLIFGDECDLRADVNGVWDFELALAHVPLISEHKVKVLEQPMGPDDQDIARFAQEMRDAGVILMADESACSFADMEKIVEDGHYSMVNVRLSKCGGFRNSLKKINYLRNQGISLQIGCQLGESGLLSAAGRALSLLCSDAVYYDGSYDEFLLRENVTLENVSFGLGGEAGPLRGPGLGVEINHEILQRLSDPSTLVTISKP